MNLLLDTHVLLWALEDHPALSQTARAAIVEGSNVVFVSAATAWEITIKRALGKVRAPASGYLEELRRHRFIPLDIATEHALAVSALPAHHADPFDRILIAQAQVERLTLATRDTRMQLYPVPILVA